MALTPGSRLGPFQIIAPLGAGGMGEVYRARDIRLERTVAIKILPAALATRTDRLQRFAKEARSASALNHPNIVTIYEMGLDGPYPYIAMELIEGKTLRELLVGSIPAPRKAIEIAAQIADGLTKAHEAGIIHRDLKPENLMVSSDGFVKILDFGLAKLAAAPETTLTNVPNDETDASSTAVGAILGTVGYMSPEQASGGRIDFRSDQFSFGSVLYEMLAGKRPFHRNTAAETMVAIMREHPDPIATLNCDAPAPLCWVIERCMAKDPEKRYGSTQFCRRAWTLLRKSETVSRIESQARGGPGVGMYLLRRSGPRSSRALLAACGCGGGSTAQRGCSTYTHGTTQARSEFGPGQKVHHARSWNSAMAPVT